MGQNVLQCIFFTEIPSCTIVPEGTMFYIVIKLCFIQFMYEKKSDWHIPSTISSIVYNDNCKF